MTAKAIRRFTHIGSLALAAIVLAGTMAGCENQEPDIQQQDANEEQEVQQPQDSGQESTEPEQAADYTALFAGDGILTMEVQLSQEDWEDILTNPTAEEYHSATVTVNGITLENVGFRTKGNSTLRSVAQSDSDRYSFRIKFDKYEKGQTLLGLDEMVVNNNYSDPSYMREYLTYEALDYAGAQVPLTAYVSLSINGELFGFYTGVEAIDDSLLERFYGNSKGNLYKADERSTLVYEEGSTYTTLDQKNGKDESREDLVEFIRLLDEMPDGEKGDIESVLDVDSALVYIAAQTMLGNYDSYNGSFAHNYFLCANDGIFSVIPWDYNMSFGGFMDGGGESSWTIPIDEPVYGVTMKSRPLISKLLAVPEYLERYHAYIERFVEYLEGFEDRVTELADLIRPYVEEDPTKFYTMEAFEANLSADSTDTGLTAQSMSAEGDAAQQQTPPEGEAPDGQQRQDGGNRRGGGGPGGMQAGGSILEYVSNRLENVKKQLSGELETTGNTTMNQGGFGGRVFGGGGMAPPDGDGQWPQMPEGMEDFTPPDFDGDFTPGEGGPPGEGGFGGGRGESPQEPPTNN